MYKLKKILVSPLIGTIILITILLTLSYFYIPKYNSLGFLIGIYGAFVATLLGVYVSLYYSREHTKEQEIKVVEKVMIGSLKMLWSELDLNKNSLENLIAGYETMPREHENIFENYKFLSVFCGGIKFEVFYGLISSGAMNDISRNDSVFNS